MNYNRRPSQSLNIATKSNAFLTQRKNQKENYSSTKIKRVVFSGLLQKFSRFKDLSATASQIWRTEGFWALMERLYRFSNGERRYSKLSIAQDFNVEYSRWIEENEPTPEMIEQQRREETRKFGYRPLISILTPVYNTDQGMLEEMIDSVLAQTYSNWELCLVNGGSSKLHVRSTLNKYALQDSRIKVKHLDVNYGISGNSNKGLKMLTGEFTALLDHDDILSADALFEIVSQIDNNPALDFIYSDKDTITEDGKRRFNPLFKPEWSPEMLFNANYLTHLNVIRTQLLEDVGGFDSKTDGAQDWDLFLRVTARTNRIAHVPRILYHWRYHQESTASGIQSKPYAPQGQICSIEKNLKQKNLEARVETGEYTIPKVIWKTRADLSLTLIIDLEKPTTNFPQLIESCLRTIYRQTEVIVLNRTGRNMAASGIDAQTKKSVRVLDFEATATTGTACQTALQTSVGEVILFLNADLKAQKIESAIHELTSWTQFEEIGAVGGMLLQPNGTIASTGLIMDKKKLFAFGAGLQKLERTPLGGLIWYRNFSAIPGECLAVRRKVVEEAGGFDVQFDKVCHLDLCLKLAAAGYRNLYTPYAVVRFQHTIYQSFWDSNLPANLKLKHKDFLEKADPNFNINVGFNKEIVILQNKNLFNVNAENLNGKVV